MSNCAVGQVPQKLQFKTFYTGMYTVIIIRDERVLNIFRGNHIYFFIVECNRPVFTRQVLTIMGELVFQYFADLLYIKYIIKPARPNKHYTYAQQVRYLYYYYHTRTHTNTYCISRYSTLSHSFSRDSLTQLSLRLYCVQIVDKKEKKIRSFS